MPLISGTYARALLPLSGNINIRRFKERDIYNKLITGRAFRSDVGEAPQTYIVDYTTHQTASLVASYSQQTASVPSWTQFNIGKHHGFVVPALSSSHHEVSRLNAFLSGTFALEATAVPASGAFFYSKAQRFVRKVYAITASAGFSNPSVNEQNPSNIENVSGRSNFNAVSGSYLNNSYYNPSVVEFNIPDYGKIRDIRVWFEFVHDIRGGTGLLTGTLTPANAANGVIHWMGGVGTQGSGSYTKHGLQNVQVSLRSPNVSFPYAHPLWNDPQTYNFVKRPDASIAAQYQGVPDLLKNSYLLWAGHAVDDDLGISLGGSTSSLPDNVWQTGTLDVLPSPVTGTLQLFSDMVMDQQGNMNLAYNVNLPTPISSASIKFATYSVGTGWAVKIASAPDQGQYPSLAIDMNNVPHIVYVSASGGTSQLTHLYLSNSVWTKQSIYALEDTASGWATAVAIDPNNGNVHAIGYEDTVGYLRHFVYRSGTWSNAELIDNAGSTGGSPSIVIDSGSNVHVTYLGQSARTTDAMRYAFQASGTTTWPLLQTITDNAAGGALLVLNSASQPRAFFGASDPFVDATLVNGQWVTASFVVPPLYSFSNPTSLYIRGLLDDVGNPHLVFTYDHLGTGSPTTKYVPTYAYNDGARWIFRNLKITGSIIGESISFNINEYGDKFIAYSDVPSTGSTIQSQITFLTASTTSIQGSPNYFEYNTDIDMRTVFSDGSSVKNPRSLGMLSASSPIDLVFSNHYPSPLSSSFTLFGTKGNLPFNLYFTPVSNENCYLTGANFPWMLDARIPPGNFVSRSYTTTSSFSKPQVPVGWLTGPSGTANPGEFPTSGTQIGPSTINPVYPMLDDVYVQRGFAQTPTVSSVFSVPSLYKQIVGFRPGLRGTEINGRWKLLIGVGSDYNGSSMVGSPRAGIWFRQARLEFIIDQGVGPVSMYPSKNRRFSKSSNVPSRAGTYVVDVVSGSSEWDVGTNFVLRSQKDEYGRSIGITDHTGSAVDDFAVFTQITGAFADTLTGSRGGVLYTFLHNEYGTPFIPLTSGSGIAPAFDPYTADDIAINRFIVGGILRQKNLVGSSNILRSTLNRLNYFQTRRDQILQNVKLGSTFGVSAFPINLSSSIFLKF